MRSLLALAFFSLGLTGVGFAQQTVIVTSSGSTGGLGLYADGTAWPVDGGFSFDVGLLPANFDPTTADPAALIPSWISARQPDGAGTVATWFRDGTSTQFSIAGTSLNVRAADLMRPQYYVWGYNSKATSAATEWVFLTNPAWRVVISEDPLLPEHFDTKDPGTVAIIGQLSNGGSDLRSARVFTSGLSIINHVATLAVAPGQPATLTVTARGTGLSYQWYAGAKGDVAQPIVGATGSSYTVGAVTATARFWVRVTGSGQTADSETITVAVNGNDSGVVVTYDSVNLGYISGHRVRVRQQVSYTGTPSRLSLSALVPAGWSYLASEGPAAQSSPAVGNTELLEWTWTTLPPSPFTLGYILVVPAGVSGDRTVTTLTAAVRDGATLQGLVLPDPLVVKAAARLHSADADRNNRIDLFELTRIIEIYNTRSGTQRTGAYRVDASTEDGFAPDRARTATDVLTLASYHSADVTPRDGRLSLVELTRVIELYNFRSGSVRTGAYYARGDTEDGFVTGVAP